MKKIKKKALTKKHYKLNIQIALIFLTFIALTIGACILVNNVFLEKYYTHTKEKTLLELYDSLEEACDEGVLFSAKNDLKLQRMSVNHNVTIAIITSLYEPVKIYSSESHDSILSELRKEIAGDIYADYVYEEEDEYILFKVTDKSTMTQYLEMIGKLSNGSFFLMRIALDSIKVSTDIANRFLLYIAIGAVLISGVLVFFVSKRVTNLINENEIMVTVDNMRKEFVSNVSHELKTPIALIQGYAEGLKENINEEEDRDYYCDVIIDEASRMNKMVKNLLTLNQFETEGGYKLSAETFDIVEMAENFVQSARLLTNQNDIEVNFVAPEDAYVCADEFKIEEVFSNYFSNAVYHCESDTKKRIDVIIEKGENIVRVSVKNTGKQIPEDSISHLFEKFYKVDKARTREYGGSGVGLSIVKAVMDAHKQKYGVYNMSEGVCFWFELKKQNPV